MERRIGFKFIDIAYFRVELVMNVGVQTNFLRKFYLRWGGTVMSNLVVAEE